MSCSKVQSNLGVDTVTLPTIQSAKYQLNPTRSVYVLLNAYQSH